jgi:hypothetical protein
MSAAVPARIDGNSRRFWWDIQRPITMPEESFYRPRELQRVPRTLPAATYNTARRLMARAEGDCLFVPVRSMQYLAVLDAEEFIFVPRDRGRMIEIAWQNFLPSARDRLDAPVPYDAVYYTPDSEQVMRRLQMDFQRALEALDRKQAAAATTPASRVLPFARRYD